MYQYPNFTHYSSDEIWVDIKMVTVVYWINEDLFVLSVKFLCKHISWINVVLFQQSKFPNWKLILLISRIRECFHEVTPICFRLLLSVYKRKYLVVSIEYNTSVTKSIYRLFNEFYALQCRHNGRDGVSNNQPHHCSLNRLFRRRPKKISKLRVTGLCVENSPVTGKFPAQMASNAENVSPLWRHHGTSRHGGLSPG